MRDIDEEVVRSRHDPRAEPSNPPPRKASEVPSAASVPPVDIRELAPSEPPAPEPAPRVQVTNVDPRLVELEPLVRAGDWDAVIKALGPDDAAGRLPPNLGLLYAVARKEKETAQEKGTASTELAMRCTASLLGVTPESAVALVVAKRLIRKNPVAFRERPAPPASITAIIIVVALVLGSAVGWLFATGHVKVRFAHADAQHVFRG